MKSLRRIKASAGSGKTYTLTEHFLRLLSGSSQTEYQKFSCQRVSKTQLWSEILAISFTNRAAAEMKERIILRLKEIALEKVEIENFTANFANSWLENILRNYNKLNVRTIDSLLHLIVRLSALELKLPPNFETSFENEESLGKVYDDFILKLKDDETLSRSLDILCKEIIYNGERGFTSNNKIRSSVLELSVLLKEEDDENSFAKKEEIEDYLLSLFNNAKKLAQELLESIEHEKLAANANLIKALQKCLSMDINNVVDSKMLQKDDINDCLLKKSQGMASPQLSYLYIKLQEAMDKLNQDNDALKSYLRTLPYLNLVFTLRENIKVYFHKHEIIPASYIELFAKEVLSQNFGVSAALCRMGTNLSHILIDEFQDTSRAQWGAIRPLVIEAISQGGNYTWVGDIKQAIYGWRGGDALLFDEILDDKELTAIEPNPQTDELNTNWRSDLSVVNTNNRIFSKLAENDVAVSLASNLLSKSNYDYTSELAQSIMKNFTNASQKTRENAQEGYFQAEIIEAVNNEEYSVIVQDKTIELLNELVKSYKYEDIAILTRTNTQGALMAQNLLNNNFPVMTENSLLLMEQSIINELLAWLKFLNSPFDDLSLCIVLNGELTAHILQSTYNLNRIDIENYLCSRDFSIPLHIQFKNSFPKLWKKLFEPFLEKASLMSAYDLMQELLQYLKAYEIALDKHAFLQHFLEVIYNYGKSGYSNLNSFLQHFEQSGHTEKAPMPEEVNAIKIMSIHKAKGLQFPVVIIPFHDNSSQAITEKTIGMVEKFKIIAPKGKLVEPKKTHVISSSLEKVNAFYVAWTRPKNELYAFLSKTEESLHKLKLDVAITELLKSEFDFNENIIKIGTRKTEKIQVQVEEFHEFSAKSCELDEDFEPMTWLPKLKVFTQKLDELAFKGKRRGNFIHACLENLHTNYSVNVDIQELIERTMIHFGLSLDTEMIEDAKQKLKWLFELSEFEKWLKNGKTEQTIISKDGQTYRLDLLVPVYNNEKIEYFEIVEYKTGEEYNTNITQLKNYIEIVKLATDKDCKGVLVYLDQYKTINV